MKRKIQIQTIFLYGTLALLTIVLINLKVNYTIDEIFSFGLSNSKDWLNVVNPDGSQIQWSSQSFQPMLDYVKVHNPFDYGQVWVNQIGDVHPPVYYIILHTICSLLPNLDFRWQSGIINLVVTLLSLFIFRKFLDKLDINGNRKLFCSWIFVLCNGILNETTFLRMYDLTILEVLLITYFLFDILKEDKGYLWFGLSLLLGALTHYYTIVYTVLVCGFAGLWMLWNKQWKKAFKLTGTCAVTGTLAVAIFPAMIEHIFFGYRGKENIYNFRLNNLSFFFDRFLNYLEYANQNMFNGFLYYILAGMALAMLTLQFKKKNLKDKETTNAVCLTIFALAIFVYFFVIVKVASYVSERYLSPVYGVSTLILAVLISKAFEQLKNKTTRRRFETAFLAIYFVWGCTSQEWFYLYRHEKDYIASLENYDGIGIYTLSNYIPGNYEELQSLNSYAILYDDQLDKLNDLEIDTSKPYAILLDNYLDADTLLPQIAETLGLSNNWQPIGSHEWITTYLIQPKH